MPAQTSATFIALSSMPRRYTPYVLHFQFHERMMSCSRTSKSACIDAHWTSQAAEIIDEMVLQDVQRFMTITKTDNVCLLLVVCDVQRIHV